MENNINDNIPILYGSVAYNFYVTNELNIYDANDIDLIYNTINTIKNFGKSLKVDSVANSSIYKNIVLYKGNFKGTENTSYDSKTNIFTNKDIGQFYLVSIKSLLTIYLAAAIRQRTIHGIDRWSPVMQKIKVLISIINNEFSLEDKVTFFKEVSELYKVVAIYTVSNFGDATAMKDIEDKINFKDTVPRFVNHDDLHDKVAKIFRGL